MHSLAKMEVRVNMVVLVAVIGCLMCLIPSGEGIKCFVCNTTYAGSVCGDPFDKEKAAEYIDECSEPNNVLCRKIWQNVHNELRIFRKCGQEISERSDCYTTVSEAYKNTVCQCQDDVCNSATNLRSQYFLMMPAAFIFIFIYKVIL